MFLHGWGGSIASFGGAINYYSMRGYGVAALDFPPFGASPEPSECWSLRDYTSLTLSVMDSLGIEKAIIIGHSFGGRVALDIAAKTDRAEKLVLVSAAGLKPKRGIGYKLKLRRFIRDRKKGRDVTKYYSPDYLAMPERLRGVFSRIVAEDLSDRLPLVRCPTLVVYGAFDTETPPYMAKRMYKGIKNSRIVRLEGGHFAYAERHMAFTSALDDFLQEHNGSSS